MVVLWVDTQDLFGVMEETRADFSRTFRTLAQFSGDRQALADALADVCASPQNVMAAMQRQRKIVAPKMPIPQIRVSQSVSQHSPNTDRQTDRQTAPHSQQGGA